MNWLRRLFSRQQLEADLEKELRFHVESQIADQVRSGLPESEARRLTRIAFGGIDQVKEDCRERRGTMGLESLLQDIRYALRQLRKSPGFTCTAVLTLALGIGATTAIFTLVQQVMLQSLPIHRPDQLWRIGDKHRCCNWDGYTQDGDSEPSDWSLFPWEAYQLFRANTPGFANLAALQAGNTTLAVRRAGDSSGPPGTANGQYVSGNFFETLGVSAWRGRLLTNADDHQGAPPVAVMSFRAWQQNYGADPSLVGCTCQINGHAFTLVGVAPPGFLGAKVVTGGMPDIWIPLTAEPMLSGTTSRLKNPRIDWLDVIGRVPPATNPQALQAHLQSELHGWLASHVPEMSPQERDVWQKQTLRVSPGGAGFSELRRDYSEGLLLLMATACCVLLLACANIANLSLARGLKRRQQTAVRVALGASRARLLRNALLESLTLSLIGGAAGVAVAWAGARLILYLAFHMQQRSTWIPVQATPSTRVLLFALAISLLTGALFGMVPAWMTSHAEPVEVLRGANRAVGGGGRQRAESAGHCPGCGLAGIAQCGRDVGRQPAQFRAPELRV